MKNRQVSAPGSCGTCRLVARTAVLPSHSERSQAPSLCDGCARLFIPRAAVVLRPLKDRHVSTLGSCGTCRLVPRTAVLPNHSESSQAPSPCDGGARPFIPWAAAITQHQRKAEKYVDWFHGQPFVLVHFRTGRWPPWAAAVQVAMIHGQLFSRAHLRVSK